jgi:hypothetical protein
LTITTINRVLEMTAIALAGLLAVIVVASRPVVDQSQNGRDAAPRVSGPEAIPTREPLARIPSSAPHLDDNVRRLLEDLALHD